MSNTIYDYSYQYAFWHSDTEESRNNDIYWNKEFINTHNILPNKATSGSCQNAKILEIGCGMGRFMIALQQLGFDNIKGIDIDKSQITIAQKENLDVELSDAVDFLKRNNEVYDAIYCLDILEHIEKHRQLELLREISKHIKDDGFLVLRVPNAMSPTASYFRYTDFTHYVSYTDNTIAFLCHNADMHYCVTRPDGEEPRELQILKKNIADIYRVQFGLKEFILTPNIVSVVFKDEKKYQEYLNNTPPINNNYNTTENENEGCRFYLPNFFKFITWFMPKKQNRKRFRQKYFAKKQ